MRVSAGHGVGGNVVPELSHLGLELEFSSGSWLGLGHSLRTVGAGGRVCAFSSGLEKGFAEGQGRIETPCLTRPVLWEHPAYDPGLCPTPGWWAGG